jgi:enoyl-CoA hydratase/carnithine racemase
MDSILVERNGGVVTVTINRPGRKNALTHPDWARLREIFLEVGDRPGDRVVVVTGAGGDFCAGADLSGLGDDALSPLEGMRVVAATAEALYELRKPTIAKVDGVAVGAGCNMALCCDLVVASERARFSEIFAKRSLSLDFGGSWLLPRLVGMQKAKQLAFFADILDAATAERFGLVSQVVAVDELDGFVDVWAQKLVAGPPVALSLTKELLGASWTSSFAQAVEAEGYAQVINLGSEDAREAFQAFREKREPTFRGR